jgi:hypothetical protein
VFLCTACYSVYVGGIFVLEKVLKTQGEKKRAPIAYYGKN